MLNMDLETEYHSSILFGQLNTNNGLLTPIQLVYK